MHVGVTFLLRADPLSMSAHKALEVVSNALQKQYERWQPRARYKQLLDPTTEEVRKLCIALRKNAKVESTHQRLLLLRLTASIYTIFPFLTPYTLAQRCCMYTSIFAHSSLLLHPLLSMNAPSTPINAQLSE